MNALLLNSKFCIIFIYKIIFISQQVPQQNNLKIQIYFDIYQTSMIIGYNHFKTPILC